jgi:hypothetical protein
MKEYVQIPAELLEKPVKLQGNFEMSYRYVGSPKPKSTKKEPAK